ncbi:hypothetical protein ACQPUZ_18650, partial [Clostridium tertium]
IDEAINEVKGKVDGLELKAEKVTLADPTNVFTATNVEDALLENKTSISEHEKLINDLKLSVSNGKSLMSTAITGKGISTSSSDTFSKMASNIDNITVEVLGGKKWASGKGEFVKSSSTSYSSSFLYSSNSSATCYPFSISGLDFTPTLIIATGKSPQYVYTSIYHNSLEIPCVTTTQSAAYSATSMYTYTLKPPSVTGETIKMPFVGDIIPGRMDINWIAFG